jgi:hypothetical protein
MNVQNVQAALVGNEEQINQQLMSIEKCKEIRNIALSDGEMSIAEEQFYIKAQLLERLVELVRFVHSFAIHKSLIWLLFQGQVPNHWCD